MVIHATSHAASPGINAAFHLLDATNLSVNTAFSSISTVAFRQYIHCRQFKALFLLKYIETISNFHWRKLDTHKYRIVHNAITHFF